MACTPSELLAPTACCDNWSQHDLLRLIVGAQCQTLQSINPMAECDFHQLMQDTASLAGKSQHDLLRIIVGVECEILQAGGLGGQSCIVCGDADPVADPNCDCAFGYNKLTGAEFIWDDDLGVWHQIAGGP